MQSYTSPAEALEAFHRGQCGRAWEWLGAHPTETGWRFAVWAPHAVRVSLVGDCNGWDRESDPLEKAEDGVWSLEVPAERLEGAPDAYRYAIQGPDGAWHERLDPYALSAAEGASHRTEFFDYRWQDADWMQRRAETREEPQPINIYEVDPGSWRRREDRSGSRVLTWDELADQLIPYAQDMGYTHLGLLPVMEQTAPYAVTGYFAADARFGAPEELMAFIDRCHQAGLGVILDWVSAHFPRGETGLQRFDGTPCYEYADPRRGELPQWDACLFDLSRGEVRSFLLSGARFWLERFHADGLRLDAVSAMVTHDFGREDGCWLPNKHGGRESIEGIDFLQQLCDRVHREFPGALMIAEESCVFPGVTHSPGVGGLGFDLKWNTGWTYDTLAYLREEPEQRGACHDRLTFSLCYAFDEHFLLPLSHDETAPGRGSMLDKMPGDIWRKFAGLRALYGYMMAHPGKKLLFMGNEFGQFTEWRPNDQLEWFLLLYDMHPQLQRCVRDLNLAYRERPELWEQDDSWDGFQWIQPNDRDNSVFAFLRWSREGKAVLCVSNFTPAFHPAYRLGLPAEGRVMELLNTDSNIYGGSDQRCGVRSTEPSAWNGFPYSLEVTVPPLATVWYVYQRT